MIQVVDLIKEVGVKPTKEQELIIEAAKLGENLAIQAMAGSGKTSTLVMTSNEVVKPSLYLAYNKAMADEAKEKFPDHVEVRTTHSLAYAHVGHEYQHKLSRPRGAYVNVAGTGSEIGRYYRIKSIELSGDNKLSSAAIGLAIRATVNTFEHSSDTQLADKHIPQGLMEEFKRKRGFVESTFRKLVLKHAKMLWKDRIDIDSDVLCTHDTYMKLFQLSKPILNGYGIIYLDEGQDTNKCLLDIFVRQTCQKIIVGDSYQSIYQWRGSMDAMTEVGHKTLYLTQSFRFGNHVASIATNVLREKSTGEIKAIVRGLDSIQDEVGLDIQVPYPYTMLYRTNAALLSEAVTLITNNVKVNIESDMKDFVKMLTSSLALYKGLMKDVKHEEITPFSTWHELETEAKHKGELSRIASIIKNGSVLRYLKVLETHYNTDKPEVILTTAHKSKGREWDNVILADDYPSPYDSKGKYIGLHEQERNLLYVACTRAKKKLRYNDSVEDMLAIGEVSHSSGLQIGNIHMLSLSGTSGSDYHIKEFMKGVGTQSDGANEALQRACDEVADYQLYMDGGMSVEEAYDRGVIDEMGASVCSTDPCLDLP